MGRFDCNLYFISFKAVLSDHLSYVTIFYCSILFNLWNEHFDQSQSIIYITIDLINTFCHSIVHSLVSIDQHYTASCLILNGKTKNSVFTINCTNYWSDGLIWNGQAINYTIRLLTQFSVTFKNIMSCSEKCLTTKS
jgi:hypothetical protein